MSNENDLVIELKKPYKFEGQEYTTIDLSGLEDLTGNDLIKAEQIFSKNATFAAVLATNQQYCIIVAQLATKLPIEFFNSAPANIYNKVATKVMGFLMSDSEE